jgi:hypothetical protein
MRVAVTRPALLYALLAPKSVSDGTARTSAQNSSSPATHEGPSWA